MSNPPSLIHDNPGLRAIYEDMRASYSKQVKELVKIPVGQIPAYQEADEEQWLALFDQHIHRYQQAFIYLKRLDLLGSAVTGLRMRSMVLRPSEQQYDTYCIPTLRHTDAALVASYADTSVDLSTFTDPQIFTRAVIPLIPSETLPWPKGQHVMTSLDPEIETVLVSVFPEERSVLMLWSDHVNHLLVGPGEWN